MRSWVSRYNCYNMVRLPEPLLGIYGKGTMISRCQDQNRGVVIATWVERLIKRYSSSGGNSSIFTFCQNHAKPQTDALIKQIGAIGQIKSFNSIHQLGCNCALTIVQQTTQPFHIFDLGVYSSGGPLFEHTAKPKPRLICLTPNLLAVCIDMVDFRPWWMRLSVTVCMCEAREGHITRKISQTATELAAGGNC